jgi:hypothetical protein
MQGYYSLIQYCPDWQRLEVCNVGVLLLCQEMQYLDARMVHNCDRVRSIFGKQHNLSYVKMFKDRFAQRIRSERETIVNLDALKAFISQRANYFRITDPRSVAVDDLPEQTLQNLFREILGEVTKPEKSSLTPLRTQLYDKIKEYNIADNRFIQKLPKVPIPGFSRAIRPCLGFFNGRFNLVVSQRFTAGNSLIQIGGWLIKGQKIYGKQNDIWGAQHLNLLAAADDKYVMEQVEENIQTFETNHVTVHTSADAMARLIYDEAKDIPQDVLAKIAEGV